jgi:hypothetical protein
MKKKARARGFVGYQNGKRLGKGYFSSSPSFLFLSSPQPCQAADLLAEKTLQVHAEFRPLLREECCGCISVESPPPKRPHH